MGSEGGFFSFLDHFTFVDNDSSRYEIGITENGFSYLDMVSEKKAKAITFEERQKRQTSAALDGSTRARGRANISKVETVDHEALCLDTDLGRIIRDVQERKKKTPIFPIALGTVLLFLLSLFFLGRVWRCFGGILFFPASFLLLWNTWKLDVSRRHVRFDYIFSGKGTAAFGALNRALGTLASSEQTLLLQGRKYFQDTRYTGGAKSLPIFARARIDKRRPPLLDMDIEVWHVRIPHKDLYFMPDHLLVFDGSNIGGVSYSSLTVVSSFDTCQAREVARVTQDSKVVGSTWRFVNNDGTPDKRFNNNTQISLVEYGILSLSAQGSEFQLYATFQKAATDAPEGFATIQELSSRPNVVASEARRRKAQERARRAIANIRSVLMDALCCVMVADGKVKAVERKRAHDLMKSVKADWPKEKIDAHINAFIQRVRQDGIRAILQGTCAKLVAFKELGKEDVLLHCISEMSNADGTLEEEEEKVCARFRASLGMSG